MSLTKTQRTALETMRDGKPSTMPGIRRDTRDSLQWRGYIATADTGLIAKMWAITDKGLTALSK